METTAGAPEPLATLVERLHPRAVLSKIVSGAGAWSIRKPPYEHPAFCLILEGSCFLHPDGVGGVELSEGDFVLLPQMPGFTLASDPGIEPTSLPLDPASDTRHGDPTGPATMRMLGGYFRFDGANARLVIRLLPPVVHIPREAAGAARVRRVVELIADETGTHRPGHDLILQRLVEVLLLEALRFRLSSPARQETGLLAGLEDAGLARALHEMHADVARAWTVEGLARIAHMSRAVFAERFARKVGMPPMEYLHEWRMALAQDLLRTERPPLARLARRVGYRSASAFSTAFTRFAGCPPSEFARSTSIT